MTETSAQFIERKNQQFEDDLVKENTIPMKDIGRKGSFFFTREAWTFLQQHNLAEKVFIIERLRNHSHSGDLIHKGAWNKEDIEYRIGYFIVGKNGRAKGHWVWGQFCPLIPEKDLEKLMKKAKKEKTII